MSPECASSVRGYLRDRVPEAVMQRRLALERAGTEPTLDWRRQRFHPENWSVLRRLLALGLRASGLYARGRRNARSFCLRSRQLFLPGLAAPFAGTRILQLSDLHLDVDGDFATLLAERAAQVPADYCIITGDFRFRTRGPLDAALEGMSVLREALPRPVYAVLGNHDSLAMIPPLEEMGIRVLFNEGEVLERDGARLGLAGVDDPHYFGCADPRWAAQQLPADVPRLLLAHSPECYREVEAAGFDAVFCGHTHGGQIRLPGGMAVLTNARCPRRFAAGSWSFRELQGYTSVGTGSSVLDVRFNCPPELTIHELQPGTVPPQ